MTKRVKRQEAHAIRKSAVVVALLAVTVYWSVPSAAAADAAYSDELVKAEFLSRFGEYVEWPADSGAATSLTIVVLAAPDVATELRRITAGRSVQGRPVRVREVKKVEETAGAHILYIGPEATGHLIRVASRANRHAVLVVTDSQMGLAQGGVINFVVADQRVRFEISLRTSARAGLKLSSRLLGVALRVTR
jgi:YfiR/HmsC-like